MAPPRHSRTAAAETCSLPSGTYEPNRAAGPHLRLPVLLKTSLARGFLLPGGVRAWLPPPRDAPLLHRHPHLHLLSSTSTLQYPGSSIDLAHVRHHHCHDSSDDQARRLTTRSRRWPLTTACSAVCGDSSLGKSAVLHRLTGLPFPNGAGVSHPLPDRSLSTPCC